MNNSVSGKTMDNVRKQRHKTSNNIKKEETIQCQNQIITNYFYRKFVGNRSEENSNIYE